MKKLLSLIIAFAIALSSFPAIAFAGDGEDDFPPLEPATVLRPDSEYSATIMPEEEIYIDFYSGSKGYYEFFSLSDGDLYIEAFDSSGNLLSYDDDGGENFDFHLFLYVEYRVDIYLKITSFNEYPVSFTFYAATSDLESVSVNKFPSKTEYEYYEPLDVSDLEILLTYKNGTSAIWLPDYSASPDGLSCAIGFMDEEFNTEKNTVFIECYGHTFTYDITCAAPHFDHAYITKMPDISVYYEDSYYFDPTGMVIELTKDGVPVETLELTSENQYVYFDYSPIVLGENTITAYIYDSYELTFTVTGIKNQIESIELIKAPDTLDYDAYATLYAIDLTGAKLKINYLDGSSFTSPELNGYEDFINGYSVTAYTDDISLTPGPNTAYILCGGVSCTFTLNGVESRIERIEIIESPDRLDYHVGDSYIDLTGAKVSIAYKDGTADTVVLDSLYTVFNGDEFYTYLDSYDYGISEGSNAVILCYKNYTDTFYVNGVSNDIKRITVNTPPKTTEYAYGKIIDSAAMDGLVLDILHNDGTIEKWDYSENKGLYKGIEVYPEFYNVYILEKNNAAWLNFGNATAVVYFTGTSVDKGDLDADGEITVADALAALRIAAQLSPETPSAILIGDMDNDYSITVADALAILRIAAKLS